MVSLPALAVASIPSAVVQDMMGPSATTEVSEPVSAIDGREGFLVGLGGTGRGAADNGVTSSCTAADQRDRLRRGAFAPSVVAVGGSQAAVAVVVAAVVCRLLCLFRLASAAAWATLALAVAAAGLAANPTFTRLAATKPDADVTARLISSALGDEGGASRWRVCLRCRWNFLCLATSGWRASISSDLLTIPGVPPEWQKLSRGAVVVVSSVKRMSGGICRNRARSLMSMHIRQYM